MSVVLTVADHEQNGFVSIARWTSQSEAEARLFIASIDAGIDDDSEPDNKTAAYAFVLDLIDANGDCVDTGKRMLPTQVAMSLAPDQVRRWLEERPIPDAVMHRAVPVLGRTPNTSSGADHENSATRD